MINGHIHVKHAAQCLASRKHSIAALMIILQSNKTH